MTEGWGAHNGDSGNTETPPAEPETAQETLAQARARRKAEKAAEKAEAGDNGAEETYRGQWQARNDDGKLAVTTSKQAALEFACPPDRVKPYKHGDTIEV